MTDKNKYFYAHQDVGLYDATIGLTVPHYELIHGTLTDIVKAHFDAMPKPRRGRILICDLGAGTGKESQAVLDIIPHSDLVAVDISAPMKKVFESRMRVRYGNLEKVDFVVSDILGDDLAEELKKHATNRGRAKYDLIISAYCIHHFELNEKQVVYQKIYDLLAPGGLMVNVDLFNYESKVVSQQAHQFDLSYIARSFDEASEHLTRTQAVDKDGVERLKQDWLLHMEKDNILDSVEAQLEQLKEIGFKHCECVFKYWQQGIIRAEKLE